MWSRVRHRRLQALSLLALAALLTTSLCLGPLYQRAMEQALAGSVLANATTGQKTIQLESDNHPTDEIESYFPTTLARYVGKPVDTTFVNVTVEVPDGQSSVATRLFYGAGECQHLQVVQGACPTEPGQVMVSSADVKVNGWAVGATVKAFERVDALHGNPNHPPKGTVTIVGVYRADPDDDAIGAPITGRAGGSIQDVGTGTDDWVTSADTVRTPDVAKWVVESSTVTWSLDTVDHDDLLALGPIVEQLREDTGRDASTVHLATDLPALATQVADGGAEGRTTVVVLVVQLIVLIAVVLWMVLVAATDDRRGEVALARLRGRGRRGAATYLLAELLPVTLLGAAVGIVVAPLVMSVVATVVFPVPVPHELPNGYLLAALGAVLAVVLVVLAAARRAVREPVDSLLRAVRARHGGAGSSVAEVVLIVFSLTAVFALVTGNLEGPLATLAPTLLAVAVGLLLGRALAPVTRWISRRLMRRGRAVAAAGIVNAVRRPAARRVLVMVVVASALFVFCVDAVVTGQRNRENAAEQANGAHYVLAVQPTSLQDVTEAVAQADPDHRHVSAVVTTTGGSGTDGSTVAVDPTAFRRLAYFPLDPPVASTWDKIAAPTAAPLTLKGATLAGTLVSSQVRFGGASTRYDDVQAQLQVLDGTGASQLVELAVVPQSLQAPVPAPFSVAVPCQDGCTVTGLAVTTPPGLQLSGTVTFAGLTVDGAPFSLGTPDGYQRTSGGQGSLVPAQDAQGDVGFEVRTTGVVPPPMFTTWVPQPVPALVTSAEEKDFAAAGISDQQDMTVAGHLPRVPGAPPGSRVVDLAGLLRHPSTSFSNDVVEVWSDDAAALATARTALAAHGVPVGDVTTVNQVRAGIDASPAAWSLALSVLVGGVAVLVAMLVMIVATATTWRARATDLAALRMAGLPNRSLRRLELLGQLPVVLVGAVAGAVSGTVAAVEALPGVRQFTDKPAVDTTDFSTPWAAVLLTAVAALVVLTALAVATSRWTARRAPLNRIREVV